MSKRSVVKRVVFFEEIGFGLVILFLWLNEILDTPHLLLGAPATPINWVESAFECAIALALAALVVALTRKFLEHIKYIEGFLLYCASCRRVFCDGKWIPVDVYVRDSSAAQVSHGLCPACMQQYCGGWGDPCKAFEATNEAVPPITDDMHIEACCTR